MEKLQAVRLLQGILGEVALSDGSAAIERFSVRNASQCGKPSLDPSLHTSLSALNRWVQSAPPKGEMFDTLMG
jgi:hypothetical protein